MRLLAWSDQASRDLEDVADFFADIDPALPNVMIGRIAAAAEPLLHNPRLGPLASGNGLRKWRAPKTSFLLLYIARGDAIIVVRVVHAAADWQSIV